MTDQHQQHQKQQQPLIEALAESICKGKISDVNDVYNKLIQLPNETIGKSPDRKIQWVTNALRYAWAAAGMNNNQNSRSLHYDSKEFSMVHKCIDQLRQLDEGADGVVNLLIELAIKVYNEKYGSCSDREENAPAITNALAWMARICCLDYHWGDESNRFYKKGIEIAKRIQAPEEASRLHQAHAEYLQLIGATQAQIDDAIERADAAADQIEDNNRRIERKLEIPKKRRITKHK